MSYQDATRQYERAVEAEAERLIGHGYAPWDAMIEAGRRIREQRRHPRRTSPEPEKEK